MLEAPIEWAMAGLVTVLLVLVYSCIQRDLASGLSKSHKIIEDGLKEARAEAKAFESSLAEAEYKMERTENVLRTYRQRAEIAEARVQNLEAEVRGLKAREALLQARRPEAPVANDDYVRVKNLEKSLLAERRKSDVLEKAAGYPGRFQSNFRSPEITAKNLAAKEWVYGLPAGKFKLRDLREACNMDTFEANNVLQNLKRWGFVEKVPRHGVWLRTNKVKA